MGYGMSEWRTDEPPRDMSVFIADIGLPWSVVAVWNGCDENYVYANLQVNMVNGVYNDTYFENETEGVGGIKRWMPMPELPKGDA